MSEEQLKWHNERRIVNDLIPFEHNPRQMTDVQVENLKKSLLKFDLVEIPVADLDNRIVAGHQRLKIMQLLGRGNEEIDVRMPNRKLTEEEFKEYNIRSNKNSGEWNFDELANFFDMEDLLQWGFEETDFSHNEDEEKEMKLKQEFQVVIDCENEIEQKEAYDNLTNEGYKCRILSL